MARCGKVGRRWCGVGAFIGVGLRRRAQPEPQAVQILFRPGRGFIGRRQAQTGPVHAVPGAPGWRASPCADGRPGPAAGSPTVPAQQRAAIRLGGQRPGDHGSDATRRFRPVAPAIGHMPGQPGSSAARIGSAPATPCAVHDPSGVRAPGCRSPRSCRPFNPAGPAGFPGRRAARPRSFAVTRQALVQCPAGRVGSDRAVNSRSAGLAVIARVALVTGKGIA